MQFYQRPKAAEVSWLSPGWKSPGHYSWNLGLELGWSQMDAVGLFYTVGFKLKIFNSMALRNEKLILLLITNYKKKLITNVGILVLIHIFRNWMTKIKMLTVFIAYLKQIPKKIWIFSKMFVFNDCMDLWI